MSDAPENEAQLAQEALAANDLLSAVSHIGEALQYDPRRKEWLEILEQLFRQSPDPLSLVPEDQAKTDHVTSALRAWVLSRLNRWDEAFALIVHSAAARPDRPFLVWAVDWIKKPGMATNLPKELVDETILPTIARFVSDVPVPMADDDVRAESVNAAVTIIESLHVLHADSPEVLFARSLVTRRLGQFDHAIYFAYQAFQNQQDWKNAVGVALANRDAGKVDDAISWYRHALSVDPDDLTARLEIGDTYLDAERWDEARRAYKAVLDRDSDQPWAEASLAYARYRKTEEASHRERLAELAETSGRAQSLLRRLEPTQPYLDVLPPAADATANALRGVMRQLSEDPQKAHGGTVTLSVTHPESPSVLNAFRLWASSRGVSVGVELKVEKVPDPDPRKPKSQVDFCLWDYDGNSPFPAVDAPDPRLAAAIGQIAEHPYKLADYDVEANELAEKIKLAPPYLAHLTATMVHPPPLPNPDMDPIEWIQRIQIAAALLISKLDEGWNPSHRKRALYSLIMGPVDWATDAAILVLGWLGRSDPAIHAEADQMFKWMRTQIPKEGYTCFEYPLACAWLYMGGHDDETQERLETWKSEIEARGRAAPDASPEEELHDGLTLQEYAEFSAWRDTIVEQHGLGVGGETVAPAGDAVYKRLEEICRNFGLDPMVAYGQAGAAPGHLKVWDERIKSSAAVAALFYEQADAARRRLNAND